MRTDLPTAALAAALFLAAGGCEDLALVHEQAASLRSPVMNVAAPDFTLKDEQGRDVSLASLRGRWVVLYFYPKDDTPGCTCEATEFTKVLSDLREQNAAVYGVSADSSATHKIFIEKYGLRISLLSDPARATMRRYGSYVDAAIGTKTYGRVIRSTFIIGPDGIIRYHWPEVIPSGHAQRVRDQLVRLQTAPAPAGKVKS